MRSLSRNMNLGLQHSITSTNLTTIVVDVLFYELCRQENGVKSYWQLRNTLTANPSIDARLIGIDIRTRLDESSYENIQ